ncbi:hypothetical protein IAQ61_010749, partial [Plenodomus lingam]|uniref:uncharacterized protein n=1 Tax=Leptosphaeria maculans TaxID=5022 RepID=UPI00332B8B3D
MIPGRRLIFPLRPPPRPKHNGGRSTHYHAWNNGRPKTVVLNHTYKHSALVDHKSPKAQDRTLSTVNQWAMSAPSQPPTPLGRSFFKEG